MASIKVKFRPSSVANLEGTVYYQIIHERRVRQILSDCKVLPAEWDPARSMVVPSRRDKGERRDHIMAAREHIRRDLERLAGIDKRLDLSGMPYTADDIVDEFGRYLRDYTLFNFMAAVIRRLKDQGRVRTSETYTAALRSFSKFRAGQDLMLDCLSSEIMEAYQAWLIGRGVVPNTVSFYCRILRAVYNRAVDRAIIENRHPFKHVYTGVDKTVKRALPLATIKAIKELDLTPLPALDYARDMFLMCFFLRGMSFIDLAFLKKSDLRNGSVIYRRRKTGQQLIIGWTREMQTILDKYPENTTDYLMPIIRRPGANERCAYRNAGYTINHNLKKIAPMVGVTIPLTLYVARHSWASAAKAKGIPLSIISEGMGHDSEATTRIYLAALDTSLIDRANSLILSSL